MMGIRHDLQLANQAYPRLRTMRNENLAFTHLTIGGKSS